MADVLSKLPPGVLSIIAIGSLVAVFAALVIFARAKRIQIGKDISIERGDSALIGACTEDDQAEILRNLENRLTALYSSACNVVRAFMLKSLGIPKQFLENNGDFIHAKDLLWRWIYGKNGKHSVRTIIEDRVVHRDYLLGGEKDPDRFIAKRRAFMRDIVDQIKAEGQGLFNLDYENIYSLARTESPGEPEAVTRVLIREDLADLINEFTFGDLSSSVEALFFEVGHD